MKNRILSKLVSVITIITFLSGCATTTKWETVRNEDGVRSKVGEDSQSTELVGISDLNVENGFVEFATASKLIEEITTRYITPVNRLQREVKVLSNPEVAATLVFFGSLFVGLWIALPDPNSEADMASTSGTDSLKAYGASAAVGVAAAWWMLNYKSPTGNTRTQLVRNKESSEQSVNENPVELRPITPFEFSSSALGLSMTGRTDNRGRASIPYQGSGEYHTSSETMYEYLDERFLQYIRSRELQNNIIDNIDQLTESVSVSASLNTLASRVTEQAVRDSSVTFQLPVLTIDDDRVYRLISSFIDREINSNISNVEIVVEDKDSRVSINNVRYILNINAPTKRELASQYFHGPLLSWAENRIENYELGQRDYGVRARSLRLNIYKPSDVQIELRHSGYAFYQDRGTVGRDASTMLARMVKLGDRITVDTIPNPEASGLIVE